MPNLDITEAEYRLNAIARLRLLFSTNTELNEFIGFKADGNNSLSRIGGGNAFLKNAVYDSLCSYAENKYGINFDRFLQDYITASEFYARKGLRFLARRHFSPCVEFVRYIYGNLRMEDISDKALSDVLPEIYSEENGKQLINIPILVLLVLGILPLYSKGRGDVIDLYGDFKTLFSFLEPMMKDSSMFASNQTLEQWKKEIAEGSEITGRFSLYVALTDILDNYVRITDQRALYLANLDIQNSAFFPLGDTLWREDETTFWRFEELDNGYFATRYKVEQSYRMVEYVRYDLVLFIENGKDYAYFIDPRGSLKLMRGKKILDSDFEVFELDIKNIPDSREMKFTSVSDSHCLQISSLTETKLSYDDLMNRFKGLRLTDKYPEATYRIISQIVAITKNYVFIPDGSAGYYKVPKSIAPVLSNASVDDNGGLFEITITKEKIIGFVDRGIYINVTYPAFFEKKGISMESEITPD